jgi:acetoin:2,6-dichlorophenolindophenol oxidoreductase subunit alpha
MRAMAGTDVAERTLAFERLVLIRKFEEEARRLYLAASIPGAVHLATGHEAVSVGVGSAIGPRDWVTCTYRGHGHALTRGVPPRALMAEMLGRATGICGGRSGSMNIVAREHRLLGSFGIIGGSMAAATGAALTLRGTGGVAVAFFGDGAANQGYFLECLNLAAVMSLPALFVCENNLYSEYTRTDLVTSGSIVDRVGALGIMTDVVDGMDVRAVDASAHSALRAIRDGAGPRFIEALTYRYVPHSRSDPVTYQPEEEVRAWTERDPIRLERARLLEDGVEEERIDAIVHGIEETVARDIQAAFSDPFPDPASIREGEFV